MSQPAFEAGPPQTPMVDTREQARELAIDWQAWAGVHSLSYGELAEWQSFFTELGTRFDLIEEFTENAIC